MATKQQSQNAITLKGSAKLVMDYLSEHNNNNNYYYYDFLLAI